MRKWLPLVAIGLGSFMLLIDITIVNVALPSMLRDLRASFGQLQWVIDIYPLALATLLLGVGATADVLGLKRVYIAGLVLFALSSLAAGVSASAVQLIVARAVQGVGAAAMFATTIALINSSYAGRDRGVAFGVWGAINGAAAAIGPVLGGVLTQALSWRWVFFVNLPLSALAVTISLRVLADERLGRHARIDASGVATFMLAAGAGTFALTRAAEVGWESVSWISAGLAVVATLAFMVVEHRQPWPILDLTLLRRRSFSGVLAGALLLSVSAFGYLAFLSVWLQSIRGLNPITGGLVYLPLSVVSLLVSLLTGRFLAGRSARAMIRGGRAHAGPSARRLELAGPRARSGRGRDRRGAGDSRSRIGCARGRAARPFRHGGGGGHHRAPARVRGRHRCAGPAVRNTAESRIRG